MGRVLSNNFALAYAIEDTLGVLPGSPLWITLEPNSVGSFGSTIATVARNPISPSRQRRKGVVTDLDSKVAFEADFTIEQSEDFIEGFCFATKKGAAVFDGSNRITSVTTTGYVVSAGGDLPIRTLVFARGFSVAGNNGLKVVGASSTTTLIKTSGLAAETDAYEAGALLEVAGVQGDTTDFAIDSSGNLTSIALDFTTLGIKVGQTIWIGGASAGLKFTNAANTGYARVMTVATHKLTLDKKSQAFATEVGTGLTVQIFFGRFVRNVATTHDDYLERSFQFEGTYPNLDDPDPLYEYAVGNYCNEMTINLPLANKATIGFGFIGTDTQTPTDVQADGASTPKIPIKTEPLNTTADIARLRITETDETGITTDFKNLTVKFMNNVTPEKVLGTLGAMFMNTGHFEVDIDATVLFTDAAVLEAIRNNTTVTMDFAVANGDGGVHFDIPSMTLGDGSKDMPVNASMLLKTKAQAFIDPVLGTSIGVSFFPYLPS